MIHSTALHSVAASREAEYLSGWQRSRAELANVRARLDQERASQRQSVTRDVIESFLTLADNFTALTRHAPAELSDNSWVQGVLHISRQFTSILEQHGIELINPEGQQFDPHAHEAIEQVESDDQSDQIVEVVQIGYRLGDQLLRPAKVKIAK